MKFNEFPMFKAFSSGISQQAKFDKPKGRLTVHGFVSFKIGLEPRMGSQPTNLNTCGCGGKCGKASYSH